MLNKLLGEIHVALEIAKRQLRLNHPELACVPGRIGVLSAKRGSKGVYFGQCQCECLRFELSAHGQVSRPGEKVFRLIELSVRSVRHIHRVESCNAKEVAVSLAVPAGDKRR